MHVRDSHIVEVVDAVFRQEERRSEGVHWGWIGWKRRSAW